MRADQLILKRGLVESRAAAQRAIEAGRVLWRTSGEFACVNKAALDLPETAELQLTESERYVSRGGLKLQAALERIALGVNGAVCLDVGQSTGGFTDCLLQAGAKQVVGADVGHAQLHARLRGDSRVIPIEGVNARELSRQLLGEHMPPRGFDLIVADVSFISLTKLINCWPALLAPQGKVLSLVKPQFEVGPEGVGKGGIVRDTSLFATVQADVTHAFQHAGFTVRDYFDSSITGSDGNREFFIYAEVA